MKIIKFIIENIEDLIEYAVYCIILGIIFLLGFMFFKGDFNIYFKKIAVFISSLFNANPYLFVFCIGVGLGVIYTIIDYRAMRTYINYHFDEEDLEKE